MQIHMCTQVHVHARVLECVPVVLLVNVDNRSFVLKHPNALWPFVHVRELQDDNVVALFGWAVCTALQLHVAEILHSTGEG
jgi:hypothetical protein